MEQTQSEVLFEIADALYREHQDLHGFAPTWHLAESCGIVTGTDDFPDEVLMKVIVTFRAALGKTEAAAPRAPYFQQQLSEEADKAWSDLQKVSTALPPIAGPAPIDQLRDLVEVQGRDGNWNMDGYMCGMFNGMELALSIMEGREPQYRTLKKPQQASGIAGLSFLPDVAKHSHQVNPGGVVRFGSADLL
jgi:hypothetical protein